MDDHRSFPDAADGRPMPPMGYTILEQSKGLLDWEGAAELARNLRGEGYYMVRSEDLGWPDIHRFQDELNHGQGVREDGGGFFVRCIMALFGKKPDPVENYQRGVSPWGTVARACHLRSVVYRLVTPSRDNLRGG